MYLNGLKKMPIAKLNFLTQRQKFLLHKLGLESAFDILNNFPTRYDDRSSLESIQSSLLKNKPVAILATVVEHSYIFFNRRRHPKIIIQDNVMRASLIGFNREYLRNSMKIGEKYWIYAQFFYKYNEVQTTNFDFEKYIEGEKPKNFGFILPVYKLTENLYIKELRGIIKKTMASYIDTIDDEIPDYILKAHNLITKKQAIQDIHFPADEKTLKKAKLRLAYEEFFSIELAVIMKKINIKGLSKPHSYSKRQKLDSFIASLPYRLTAAQLRVIGEIILNMNAATPMHRLLQGDVGCGKTTVALAGMIYAAENGRQAALMVPTEVLALQHYNAMKHYLDSLKICSALLTGSIEALEKDSIYTGIREGKISIVVGTQALIQELLEFKELTLCVFDEQHRFGVEQRISLSKKGKSPDILVMTATPIPRTLTLTLYGDLDLSVIDEMPAGRRKIITKWISKKEYPGLINLVEEELKKGHQAYFIYPLIEESEKVDTENAIRMHRVLSREFSDYRVGLLHGRMSAAEKYEAMDNFRAKRYQVLVSTTVIEVGIDVKNATVMVIEGSERFGLSQLHQLRGRVGRDIYDSYCILVTSGNETDETKARMTAMVSHSDGFLIAEEDLKLRGPGEILGIRQSGIPELKIADYIRNEKLLLVTKQDATNILKSDPALHSDSNKQLREGIIDFLPSDYLYSG
jgi:ATP-dependent DNA helicase RecG